LFLVRRHRTWIVRSTSALAADQRVDLAGLGLLVEVDAVGLERLAAFFFTVDLFRLRLLLDAAPLASAPIARPLAMPWLM
jgi:hypothetical protein